MTELQGRVAVVTGAARNIGRAIALDLARGGARVVIDPDSFSLLAGSELDYADELMGAHFAVKNPQAKSSCGCGTSFSVD